MVLLSDGVSELCGQCDPAYGGSDNCGTGLFYSNDETLPGIIDVQSATLDEPDLLPPEFHTQVAERISWAEKAHELPVFERYPPAP
jgi:hypothetical protein